MSDQKVPGAGLFSGLSEKIQEAESAESKPTMNMAALLELPAEQRKIVRHLLRADSPPTVAETAAALEMTLEEIDAEIGIGYGLALADVAAELELRHAGRKPSQAEE